MSDESKALTVTQALVPAVVFAPGGVDTILNKIKAEVAAVDIDIATPAGRRDCASLAYKVARSKTALDEMGKELGENHYRAWKSITAERSKIVKELDTLKDEVRRPLTDWENAEKARVEAHEAAIAAIHETPEFYAAENTADDLRRRLTFLEEYPSRDWQEFAKRASTAFENEIAKTKVALSAAEKREAEAAEALRFAAEKAENERKAREAAVAAAARREAEEKAATVAKAEAQRAEAEKRAAVEKVEREKREAAEKAQAEAKAAAEKAQREREAIEAERRAAEARAYKAEEDRLAAQTKAAADAAAAARKAETERQAAAEKAERDKQAAVEAERRRVADAQAKEAAAATAREADRKHRAAINATARDALIKDGGLSEQAATAAITAIARGAVPAVRIAY